MSSSRTARRSVDVQVCARATPWPELLAAARRALCGYRSLPSEIREEIVQEAAFRLSASSGVAYPGAFVRRVAHHLAIDALRRRRSHVPLDTVADDPVLPLLGAGPWERVDAALEVGRAVGWLTDAPRRVRETVEALVLAERTIDELLGDAPDRMRARDVLYKRRARAAAWMRARRGAA